MQSDEHQHKNEKEVTVRGRQSSRAKAGRDRPLNGPTISAGAALGR
jgi:hypothetical protein